MEALSRAPPGSSVVTDSAGTRVQEPSDSVDRARARVHAFVKEPYFDPSLSTAWTGATTPATLVRYHAEKQVSNTLYSTVYTPTELEAMDTTIAIFVGGACRETGNGSRAGYGVFFGEGSKYNVKGVVDCGQKQTSQAAEITAVSRSLEVLNEVWKTVGLLEVVIITDSDYLVKSMCEHIRKSLKNGFKTSRGRKVENEGLLRNLHERIEELRRESVEVKFWRVKRSTNKEAEGLAKEALGLNLGGQANPRSDGNETILSTFKRHQTTAELASMAEDGPENPMNGKPLSKNYFKILQSRRNLPVHAQR